MDDQNARFVLLEDFLALWALDRDIATRNVATLLRFIAGYRPALLMKLIEQEQEEEH